MFTEGGLVRKSSTPQPFLLPAQNFLAALRAEFSLFGVSHAWGNCYNSLVLCSIINDAPITARLTVGSVENILGHNPIPTNDG